MHFCDRKDYSSVPQIKNMKQAFIILQLMFFISTLQAQNQEYGAITYKIPTGYQAGKSNDVLTYSKQNKSNGSFCLFMIYQLANATGTTQQCFDYYWKKLVQEPNNITAEAAMQPEAELKGWHFLLGNATYPSNGITTLALQITFTGADKMQNVIILSNSDSYKKDIEDFIANADLTKEAVQLSDNVQSNKPTSTSEKNTSVISNAGSVENKNIYTITIPPTWKMAATGDNPMLEKLTNAGKRVIEFMQPIQSSGDLEKDMAHIFFEVFDGWKLRVPNTTVFENADHEKGLTSQGLNYYMLSNSISKEGADVIKATVLLIQDGENVAIINSTDNILGSEVEMALHFLLFNLKIKGVAEKNIDYKKQILGTWGFSSGLYGNSLNSVTNYNADGKCYTLLQSSYTVGYDYYNDLIKKKQFTSQSVYSFDSNVLERKSSSAAKSKYFIRFYSRKYGTREWEDCMSLYDYNYNKEKIDAVMRFTKFN